MWAGNRVQHAEQRGFSTIDAIFDYFQINRELSSGIDPEEAELLRHQAMQAGSCLAIALLFIRFARAASVRFYGLSIGSSVWLFQDPQIHRRYTPAVVNSPGRTF